MKGEYNPTIRSVHGESKHFGKYVASFINYDNMDIPYASLMIITNHYGSAWASSFSNKQVNFDNNLSDLIFYMSSIMNNLDDNVETWSAFILNSKISNYNACDECNNSFNFWDDEKKQNSLVGFISNGCPCCGNKNYERMLKRFRNDNLYSFDLIDASDQRVNISKYYTREKDSYYPMMRCMSGMAEFNDRSFGFNSRGANIDINNLFIYRLVHKKYTYYINIIFTSHDTPLRMVIEDADKSPIDHRVFNQTIKSGMSNYKLKNNLSQIYTYRNGDHNDLFFQHTIWKDIITIQSPQAKKKKLPKFKNVKMLYHTTLLYDLRSEGKAICIEIPISKMYPCDLHNNIVEKNISYDVYCVEMNLPYMEINKIDPKLISLANDYTCDTTLKEILNDLLSVYYKHNNKLSQYINAHETIVFNNYSTVTCYIAMHRDKIHPPKLIIVFTTDQYRWNKFKHKIDPIFKCRNIEDITDTILTFYFFAIVDLSMYVCRRCGTFVSGSAVTCKKCNTLIKDYKLEDKVLFQQNII